MNTHLVLANSSYCNYVPIAYSGTNIKIAVFENANEFNIPLAEVLEVFSVSEDTNVFWAEDEKTV